MRKTLLIFVLSICFSALGHGQANDVGILVGGMTYTLDPTVKPSSGGHGGEDQCGKIAESLLACLDTCIDTKREKVKRVRIRKINIDIEIDDGCQD